MTKTVHVVFGNVSLTAKYIREDKVDITQNEVIMATHPETVYKYGKDASQIFIIRFPEDVWQPTTLPCEKRVKETEGMIKGFRRLGGTVIEVR